MLRPGEVLEYVPGVIITQHSGDGKANQYFLRGFNLDHGTDFLTTIDHMPVNMPTHAHGQGYSDINFLLPELVSRIAYKKGPYSPRKATFPPPAPPTSTTTPRCRAGSLRSGSAATATGARWRRIPSTPAPAICSTASSCFTTTAHGSIPRTTAS